MQVVTRRSLLAGAAALGAGAPLGARAYPVRPITLVVPFAAGGSTDILARIVSDHLQRALKQPVVVENRTGASGNIGTAAVARAERRARGERSGAGKQRAAGGRVHDLISGEELR